MINLNRREEKREERRDAQSRSCLNRRANLEWNPCKSSLQLYLTLSTI